MSPDSPETRIRILEGAVAKLEQRVEDLLDRLRGQFDDFEEDVRTFAPLVKDVNTLQNEMGHVNDALRDLKRCFTELSARIDNESQERRAGQAERKKEIEDAIAERKKEQAGNKTLIRVAAISLAGTFLTSVAAVVAAVIMGGHP